MSKAPWRLSPFDWGDFIKEGALFVNLLGGAVAGVLGALGTLPPWMIRSDRLLVLSLFFAFCRVWKTVREEFESDGLWSLIVEGMSPRGSGLRQVKDAVFEIPYLFSITFLPISAVSLQTFAACLILFYVADNFYNLALLKGIAGEEAPGPRRQARRAVGRMVRRFMRGRFEAAMAIVGDAVETMLPIGHPHQNTIDREVLTSFFGRRVMFNRFAILLLAADLAMALFGPRDVAEPTGCAVVAVLLVMELLVEPARVLGVQYEPEGSEGPGSALDGAGRYQAGQRVESDVEADPRRRLPAQRAAVHGRLPAREHGQTRLLVAAPHRASRRLGSARSGGLSLPAGSARARDRDLLVPGRGQGKAGARPGPRDGGVGPQPGARSVAFRPGGLP